LGARRFISDLQHTRGDTSDQTDRPSKPRHDRISGGPPECRISTETDVRLSFDLQGSINKARQLIKLYEDQGIDRERAANASSWSSKTSSVTVK